ncbi:bifunctional phosphoribosyl-AMP cyclohydrolase/phosphoribosyl-ATP diphosphatase HisIE [Velocimicrobium porci]|uniref:Histidine biosynthesis bifunctional protein HisIE n=1 Tax=Velocimicrobium porci TaxID=2606634 RepID=A0A6L5XYW1_9FIRM|nr:bifunctional phosphoribosyl-AMP cyclohydrolase/phosphoribosyl-ATP diphosphatase HisIE [Velocimicrobium porci]MSS64040.1 bifunctional phosphoribosyl-AMP cyclohydrolase/phosphoribosyl-ATP diphosphatase HisIE [Velocimicrobium porci]
MNYKKIIAYINAENEMGSSIIRIAKRYEADGADELYIYNYSKDEASRDEFLSVLRTIGKEIDIPYMAGCYIERFEDIKKLLYTGASCAVIEERYAIDENEISLAIKRFGSEKIWFIMDSKGDFSNFALAEQKKVQGYGGVVLKHIEVSGKLKEHFSKCPLPIIIRDSLTRNILEEIISLENVVGVATNYYKEKDIMKAKLRLKEEKIAVHTFESSLSFSDFKLNNEGLIPVTVQDYKTGEVLMLAYMNEEAFNKTIETGKMTYYSRSRKKLWCKGETSSHYQYVKHLLIDCDNDTILAKVKQIGEACHTGNRSCFCTTLVDREAEATSPYMVLQDVYQVIKDRKKNPKEGSYTNYLFEKGIDKILKKCGEEATEIVIAAKNPDAEELKYEISDFLYHLMVLMAECNLEWEDVAEELAHRR